MNSKVHKKNSKAVEFVFVVCKRLLFCHEKVGLDLSPLEMERESLKLRQRPTTAAAKLEWSLKLN